MLFAPPRITGPSPVAIYEVREHIAGVLTRTWVVSPPPPGQALHVRPFVVGDAGPASTWLDTPWFIYALVALAGALAAWATTPRASQSPNGELVRATST